MLLELKMNRIDVKIVLNKDFYAILFDYFAKLSEIDPYNNKLAKFKFIAISKNKAKELNDFQKSFCIISEKEQVTLFRNGNFVRHDFAGCRTFNDEYFAVYRQSNRFYLRYIGYRETLEHNIPIIDSLKNCRVIHYKAENKQIKWYEKETNKTDILAKYSINSV